MFRDGVDVSVKEDQQQAAILAARFTLDQLEAMLPVATRAAEAHLAENQEASASAVTAIFRLNTVGAFKRLLIQHVRGVGDCAQQSVHSSRRNFRQLNGRRVCRHDGRHGRRTIFQKPNAQVTSD
jgi:hypothetical protein